MRRGPIIHGVLLVAALLVAYQTWTREEVVAPITGEVVVWSIPAAEIQAITYVVTQPEGRTIRVERRSDSEGPYFWGLDTRTIEQYQPRADDAPDAAPDDERPYAPIKVSSTREFMIGEKGEKLFEHLSELRALREIGKVDEDRIALYGLRQTADESIETISVIHAGGSRSLIVGDAVFGSSDRYALDPESGKAYVVSQVVVRDLANGEAGLRLAKLHEYESGDVDKVVLDVKGQKRTLVRTTVTDENGRETKTWADAQVPDKPDQTMSNFLRNVDMLRPSSYTADLDMSEVERVVRVEYQTAAGAPLGWLELYQRRAAAAPASDGAGASDAASASDAAGASDAAEGEKPAAGAEAAGAEAAGAEAAGAEAAGAEAAGAEAAGAEAAGAAEGDEAAGAAGGEKAAEGEKDEERRPAFYMRTELMRVPAAVVYSVASRITEDVDQIFRQ